MKLWRRTKKAITSPKATSGDKPHRQWQILTEFRHRQASLVTHFSSAYKSAEIEGIVWKLSVNLKKTKIIVFNKLERIFDLRIPFEGKVIEPCSRYDYLGTTFTPSGQFSLGRKTLYKKASRAMFSFLSEINLRAGAQPSTIQKLFRALVRLILLYNCEVWGAFLKTKSNSSFEKF